MIDIFNSRSVPTRANRAAYSPAIFSSGNFHIILAISDLGSEKSSYFTVSRDVTDARVCVARLQLKIRDYAIKTGKR